MNVASILERGAARHPDAVAITGDGGTIHFGELRERCAQAAGALRAQGVARGCRVALVLPNEPEFVYAYYGALQLGAIAVSLNPTLTPAELSGVLADCAPRVTVRSANDLMGGKPVFDIADLPRHTPAAILYTSGTTGTPKGATLSHNNIWFTIAAKQRYLGLTPRDRVLAFLPLFHCFGQNAILNAALYSGAAVVLQNGFDPQRVLTATRVDGATVLCAVPAAFAALLDRASPHDLASVRLFFSAGAPLPRAIEDRWLARFGKPLHQGYGLTETSPFATYNHLTHYRPGSAGVAVAGVGLRVTDPASGAVLAAGQRGEVEVHGANVMIGYWNRPAETAEAIRDGWFRTGDIGRLDAEGHLTLEDRLKDLIIVGGLNVYPAEVENALYSHPAVAEAAVYGVEDPALGEQVRAAVVCKPGEQADEAALAAHCRSRLAPYKVPAAIELVDGLPRNRSGKLLKRVLRNRHAAVLPSADRASGATSVAGAAEFDSDSSAAGATSASSAIRATIATSATNATTATPTATAAPLDGRIAAWLSTRLGIDEREIDHRRPFAELGLTSLMAFELAAKLSEWTGRSIEPAIAWSFSTVETLARNLDGANGAQIEPTSRREAFDEPMAIVGMGCRYPGAPGIEALWRLMENGVDAITDAPPERWDTNALYDPNPAAPGKLGCPKGGFVRGIEEFDAAFFGISPREAPHVDPRQRLILESAWEALESAGIPPDSLAGTATGVFLATLTNDYDHLLFQDLVRAEAFSGAGTANSVVANRVSYFLDLHGPSLALDTACSGSLVALHLACESLRRGECTLALAGGVNLNLMPKSSVFFTKAGALSPEGRCATFSASANGIVRSDGAGVVVLKRLAAARAAGDPIVAVIRSSAVNHDGRSNGIMAPNGEAQRRVIEEAYRRAGVSPGAVQFIEAHGTGTKLGDPIEVGALAAVLARGRHAGQPCVLGSLKTNIGHSEAAAGIGGVIKTALSLQRRLLPGTLHFEAPNPLIAFDALPFEVRTQLGPWPNAEAPLLAGVSGFGFGGTNAHIVLEEGPPELVAHENPSAIPHETPSAAAPYILPLSARDQDALQSLAAAYCESLETVTADPAAICYTASVRRTHMDCRMAVTGASSGELAVKLRERLASPAMPAPSGKLAFVFSGQGTHWAGMGRALAAREPVFGARLQACDGLFRRYTGWSLIEEIERPEALSRLACTAVAQPCIFAIQAALWELWRSWGAAPDLIIGHSLGEAAAALASGALTLDEAVQVVYHRSRLMARVEGLGATAVIGLGMEAAAHEIQGRESELAIAGSNSPAASVLSGAAASVEALVASLSARGIFCRMLDGVRVAFHSPHMDALLPELTASLAGLRPKATRIPLWSTVTAAQQPGERLDAAYWARNLREPFLFARATERMLAEGVSIFVEAAPHTVLGPALLQTVRRANAAPLQVLASMRKGEDEAATLTAALAALYESGREVRWRALYPKGGRVVSLPHYPWQRKRHWLDQIPGSASTPHAPLPAPCRADEHPLLGRSWQPASGDAAGTRYWESELSAYAPAFLADHRVNGQTVLPAAAILEMALSAARQSGIDRAVVGDLALERALTLPEVGHLQVQFALSEGKFTLHSRHQGEPWRQYASGSLHSGAPLDSQPGHLPSWTAIRDRVCDPVSVERHYADLRDSGLDYGERFRLIEQLLRAPGEACSQIRLPGGTDFALHPAALDSALHTVAAALGTRDSYLPHRIERFELTGTPQGSHFWSYAALMGSPGDAQLTATLILFDETGSRFCTIGGFTLRRFQPLKPAALAGALLEAFWEPRPLPAPIQAASTQHSSTQPAPGHSVPTCPTPSRQFLDASCPIPALFPYEHVVFRATRDPNACAQALALAAAIARSNTSPRLWFLGERGNLDHAPLAGLALTVDREHPALRCTYVELDSPSAADPRIEGELAASDPERRIEWRADERFALRLKTATLATAPGPAVRPDSTYLITGGFGALGLLTASRLIELGARSLVLTGRSGAKGREADLAALERPGVTITTAACDLADAAAVQHLFRDTLAGLPPLRGVIHSAGVLDDTPLTELTPARLARVMEPKVNGAWNLHLHTQDMALDWFVLYSSAASLVGSPGQANYAAANAYLDALARHRRALGRPAVSVNWGAWDEGGMASNETVRRRMAARGVTPIAPEAGLEILEALLTAPEPPAQIGVFPVEWSRFLEAFTGAIPALFNAIAQSHETRPARASVRPALDAAAGSERTVMLAAHVLAELAAVLGAGEATHIGPRQRFFDLGMDSLMAVELRNRLQTGLEIALPATAAFDYPSADALTAWLAAALWPPSAPEPGQADVPAVTVGAAGPDLDTLDENELARLLELELGTEQSFAD